MKTITTKIMSAVALFSIMITAESCSKEKEAQGYMTVSMTDAPADYKAVNVEIIGVKVHSHSKGWISLPTKEGIYNLLDLQNNVMVVLSHNAVVPGGEISELRLILGSKNTVIVDDKEFELTAPSAEESGLKIKINETISDKEFAEVILDFDAKESIVQTESGKYILKPVIRLKNR